jgi:hypothetical protein
MRERWFRLNARYAKSKWLKNLPGDVRRLWPDVLAYVKQHGVAGEADIIDVTEMADDIDTTPEALAMLITAGIGDEALELNGRILRIVNWKKYQDYDATAAARMRKMRGTKEPELRVVNGQR